MPVSQSLLGGHEDRGADDVARRGDGLGAVEARHAKIDDLRCPGFVEQDVGGLQVAMEHSRSVHVLDAAGRVADDPDRFEQVQWTAVHLHALLEIASAYVLHDEVRAACVLAAREDADDVGVQARSQLGFSLACEALAALLTCARDEGLERVAIAVLHVLDQEHHTVASRAQALDDSESRDHTARAPHAGSVVGAGGSLRARGLRGAGPRAAGAGARSRPRRREPRSTACGRSRRPRRVCRLDRGDAGQVVAHLPFGNNALPDQRAGEGDSSASTCRAREA